MGEEERTGRRVVVARGWTDKETVEVPLGALEGVGG